MTLKTTHDAAANTLQIFMGQRFDFRVHREFRDAYSGSDGTRTKYVIDLNETNYMDSSALGMLLLLREHSAGDNSRLILKNVKPDLLKILRISNFDQLFTIHNG
jgi:anti-anti-sigma factor